MRGKREAGGRRLEPAADTERPRRKAPVFVYLAVLFVAAFLMLLLAYFMQARNDEVNAEAPNEAFLYQPAAANDRIFAIIP